MQVGVPAEAVLGEHRVAMVPDVVGRLLALGCEVAVETGAGLGAHHGDEAYVEAGAKVIATKDELLGSSDVVCKVQAPTVDEARAMRQGTVLVSMLQPSTNLDAVAALLDAKVSAFSLDLLPRISRAQSMDALSSQSTVSGYVGTIIVANRLPRFFPMLMTAAGTIPPAKVLVMGAGVAGLQAISTARRLGAVVRAYDVRASAKEEVKSLGAAFVEVALEAQEGEGGYAKEQSEDFLLRQRELLGNEVAASNVVITTAAIPGRQAPVLVTAEMVARMTPGSVIVDLASESGGNCELSIAGEEVVANGVLIYGAKNVPSLMAVHASFLFARNVTEFVGLIAPKGVVELDFEDEIVSGMCVTHDGEVRNEPTIALLEKGS